MRNLGFLLLVGLIVYAIISLVLRTRSGPAGPARPGRAGGWPRGRKPKPSSGPVAPDDDPEFLWHLEQQQRQAEREANGTDQTKGTDTGEGSDKS